MRTGPSMARPPASSAGRHRRGLLHPDRGGLTRLAPARCGRPRQPRRVRPARPRLRRLRRPHQRPLSADPLRAELRRRDPSPRPLAERGLCPHLPGPQRDHLRVRPPPPGPLDRSHPPWVNGYWRYLWANKYLPVTAIDTVANVFTITDRPGYPIATGRFWYGLNLLEEIDRPGEWYLERDPEAPGGTFGKLYLWPPPGAAEATTPWTRSTTPPRAPTAPSSSGREAEGETECDTGTERQPRPSFVGSRDCPTLEAPIPPWTAWERGGSPGPGPGCDSRESWRQRTLLYHKEN